jgi:hypothetical protein
VVAAAQDNKSKPADVKVSSGERDAAAKIEKATGTEAKLQAASAFIKKYPTSTLRPQIAKSIADEIANAQDNQLKTSLAQTYLDIFNAPTEADYISGPLMEAYLVSGHAAEAFKMAPAWFEKHPDDVDTYRRLAIVGSNAAITGDSQFVPQARQYGVKALELIEADKKPASADAASWADYKTKMLPGLYREVGILSLRTGDKADGRARLEKAITLGTNDPSAYAIIGQMSEDDYTNLVNQYKLTSAGPARDAAFKKAQDQLDKVIDLYAHAVALAEGHPEYDSLRTQLMPPLTDYYKFRHNNSDAGLQQLIDKYKKPAAQ